MAAARRIPGSPLAWVLHGAAARRQVGQTEPAEPGIAALTVAAAVVNAPPTATVAGAGPTRRPAPSSGQLTARDPEGAAVAATVVPSPIPVPGTVAYNATARTITYTPTTAQRFAASTTRRGRQHPHHPQGDRRGEQHRRCVPDQHPGEPVAVL